MKKMRIVFLLLGSFILFIACKKNMNEGSNTKELEKAFFKVTVTEGAGFKITVKNGNVPLSKEQLKKVEKDTQLNIEMEALDGWEAGYLQIDEKKYVKIEAGKITVQHKVIKDTIISGEVQKINKYNIEVNPVANGVITVKKVEGGIESVLAGDQLKNIVAGTSIKAELKANNTQTHKPIQLTVGTTQITTVQNNAITYEFTLNVDTTISGEIQEIKSAYNITVQDVANGVITVKKVEGGSETVLAGDQLKNIVAGTSIKAELKANNSNTHEPKKLTVAGHEEKTVANDAITYEFTLNENITISGEVQEIILPDPPVINGNNATYKVNGVTFVMKKIDGVENASLGWKWGQDDEKHTCSLQSYWIAETEVTQALWEEVMKSNPSFFDGTGEKHLGGVAVDTVPKGDEIQVERPVDSVNWYDCIAFCNELTKLCMGKKECVYYSDPAWKNIYTIEDAKDKRTPYIYKTGETDKNINPEMNKKGFRLPTNDEWEWAAKANKHKFYAGTEEPTQLKEYGWFSEDNKPREVTHQVKKLKENAFDLYDMNGNVMEWCWDGYKFGNLKGELGKNPITLGDEKVLKGASYFTTTSTMMLFPLAKRLMLKPDTTKHITQCGMRLACFYFD